MPHCGLLQGEGCCPSAQTALSSVPPLHPPRPTPPTNTEGLTKSEVKNRSYPNSFKSPRNKWFQTAGHCCPVDNNANESTSFRPSESVGDMHDLDYDVCVKSSWRTSEKSNLNQFVFGAPDSRNCSQTALHLRNPADGAQFKADPSTDAVRPSKNSEKNMMKTETQ